MVDGFISNLLFPAKLPLLYKDIFLGIVYFFFVINEPVGQVVGEFRRRVGTGAWLAACGFFLIAFFQIFNPMAAGLTLGLLGLKVLCFYWPLSVLSYAYVTDLKKARGFLKVIVFSSIPILCFGLYQYIVGPQFLIAFGPGFNRAIVSTAVEAGGFKTYFRIIGTFASTGQFSSFLVVNAIFCLALTLSATTRKERLIFSALQFFNFLILLGTGSRGWFTTLLFQILVLVVFSKNLRPTITVLLITGFSLYGGFKWMGGNVLARYGSLLETKMVRMRTLSTTSDSFVDYLNKYPLGKGLGAGSTASRHLGTIEPLFKQQLIENYPAKLQFETGIGGVIVFYLLSLLLILRIWRWLSAVGEGPYALMQALCAYCMIHFSAVSFFSLLDSPPTPIFLWAVVGILAKLNTLHEEGRLLEYSPEAEKTPPDDGRMS